MELILLLIGLCATREHWGALVESIHLDLKVERLRRDLRRTVHVDGDARTAWLALMGD